MEVEPSFPAKTIAEFIAYAKANPGKLNIASGPLGTANYVAADLFKTMAGVEMVHVPYDGPQGLNDLLGGRVQVMFDNIPSSIGFIKAGTLRALAVTSAARMEALPDLPAMSEFVPGYEASSWQGIGVPRNTPSDIVDRLNREINAALADPAMKTQIANLGSTILVSTPAEFGRLIADETEKWGKVVKLSGAKAG
jgi:tripartite-type tricarboxylate transporter receptor subunit TctC